MEGTNLNNPDKNYKSEFPRIILNRTSPKKIEYDSKMMSLMDDFEKLEQNKSPKNMKTAIIDLLGKKF